MTKVPTLSEIRSARSGSLDELRRAAAVRAAELDAVLRTFFDRAFGAGGAALVAVGGYGRGELSPHSDVDVLILSDHAVGKDDLKPMLYPLWDAGFSVGHAVLSPRAAVERARTDLHAATALLHARPVAGDARAYEELHGRTRRWLDKGAKALVRRIVQETADRHARVERAGWSLAPDLKDDVGGLRDVHHLAWLRVATVIDDRADADLDDAYGLLIAVREALHGIVKRKVDRLHMELQTKVARALGLTGDEAADALMARVHASARTIEHSVSTAAEEIVERTLTGPRRSGSSEPVSPGVRLEDGALSLEGTTADLPTAMRLLAAAAVTGRPITRRSLARLRSVFDRPPLRRWDDAARGAFDQLLAGPHATAALETLDHLGAWPLLIPEWDRVRGRAQHDPYHRYTVDGHSFVAVAEVTRTIDRDPVATTAAQQAGRLRTLYLAALLHDVGKGSNEDHSIAGERLARTACERMGSPTDEVDEVAALVRYHLLLPDTATRRDLDDGAVIGAVADTVREPRLLRLLYILSAADGRATGPEAWSDWKAALVRELYTKTLIALEKGDLPARRDVTARAREIEAYEPSLAGRAASLLATLPPSYLESTAIPDMVDEMRLLLDDPAPGDVGVRIEDGTEAGQSVVMVCVRDRPGALARTAGALTLNRLPILRAQAFSTTEGLALQRFIVRAERGPWDAVERDLRAAYSGRLALEAQLEKKVRDYRPSTPVRPDVRVLQDVSAHSSVIEVRGPDALGLLYSIGVALTELDLDIHVAKIDTLGHRVVDVFYVRTSWGTKLEPEQVATVERAILHRVERLFGD